jgi:mycothiol synthase
VEPEPWHPADAPPADMANYHALWAACDAELFPEGPIWPFSNVVAQLLHVPEVLELHHWVLRDAGGRITGTSSLRWERSPYNRHLADVRVMVHPDHRRRGVGRRLLRPAAELARRSGRSQLLADDIPDTGPGPAFAAAAGFTKGATERRSRLQVADLDVALLRQWAKGTGGYQLLLWEGPTSDEHLADFAALKAAQSDAPWGDIEVEPQHYETSDVTAVERSKQAAGCEVWTAAVRPTDGTGLAGFTQLFTWPVVPDYAWQAWTVVAPAHRGKGLARWVKAANALRLLDERPAVTYVDTVNEVTNAPMLNVNIEMGFKPLLDIGSWTAPATTVAACAAEER